MSGGSKEREFARHAISYQFRVRICSLLLLLHFLPDHPNLLRFYTRTYGVKLSESQRKVKGRTKTRVPPANAAGTASRGPGRQRGVR